MTRILTIAILFASLASSVAQAESPESYPYIAEFSCSGGKFGLRLPPHLSQVLELGAIEREAVDEAEKWEGFTTVRKYIWFSGLNLSFYVNSNDPTHYQVKHAEITNLKWSSISPFHVGESVASVRGKLGPTANNDPDLKLSYGSEDGDVSFKTAHGKITNIHYACYTG